MSNTKLTAATKKILMSPLTIPVLALLLLGALVTELFSSLAPEAVF